ncbi:unnamed protein product [Blepharisma stoltei]|uniref:Maturase K n=1 Tax=Blepharisma stoltei TaxID=1481888 RepID=A0AAU9K0N6_9CILI|nr:unnamed protein product [Blepharisma stoltei]
MENHFESFQLFFNLPTQLSSLYHHTIDHDRIFIEDYKNLHQFIYLIFKSKLINENWQNIPFHAFNLWDKIIISKDADKKENA